MLATQMNEFGLATDFKGVEFPFSEPMNNLILAKFGVAGEKTES
jgi:hypothetical protein